jgi:hypothetical protein
LTDHFIPRSCPDLLELQITPLGKQDHTVENFEAIKVFASAYNGTSELAAEDSPFQRFHKDYANVHTLRFDGKWEREWEPLIHLVLMACPSIRHEYMNCYGTNLLKWPAIYSPDITMKLETFVWKVPNGGNSMTAAYTGEELDCALENQATFTKPSLQFSGRLKYLHLDALHFGDTSKLRFAKRLLLVSFWLTGAAAGSIKRFGTSMAVVDMRTWPYVSCFRCLDLILKKKWNWDLIFKKTWNWMKCLMFFWALGEESRVWHGKSQMAVGQQLCSTCLNTFAT